MVKWLRQLTRCIKDSLFLWLLFVPAVLIFLVLAGLLEGVLDRRKGRAHA